jgi:oxygen-independent coproporphyrinogen-3 oxidase
MQFSLYVHIPYCQAKCPYCDFNSYAVQRWPEDPYVAALCAELRHYAARDPWCGGEIATIFFGGGTPSLFSPVSIGKVLDQVAVLWTRAPDLESTLEANPGTVSVDQLGGLRAVGINRLSVGVQSFAAHHLRTLGRIHDAEQARTAIHLAREAGFTNVSVDLIFALPNQTLAEWEDDLMQACALQPQHISAYSLTYEEGTPFYQRRAQGQLQPLPEETDVAMFTRSQQTLGAAGYRQYEISNYAQPGYACRHNLNYWRGGSYVGVGAGAHSYAATSEVSVRPDWGRRWSNETDPNRYLGAVDAQGHARCSVELLDERQARGEYVFLRLRCRDGLAAAGFRDRFHAEFDTAFPQVADLVDAGLLQCTGGQWELTARGLLLADSVFATFL